MRVYLRNKNKYALIDDEDKNILGKFYWRYGQFAKLNFPKNGGFALKY